MRNAVKDKTLRRSWQMQKKKMKVFTLKDSTGSDYICDIRVYHIMKKKCMKGRRGAAVDTTDFSGSKSEFRK